jgi:hypothetical protein
VSTTFAIIDSLSLAMSIFSIYVTYSIYQKYRLNRTIAFVVASVNIFIWNLCHVFYDLLPEDEIDIARIVWYVANISGALIIVATIHGFSSLRHEGLEWPLILYDVTVGVFLTAFLLRRDIFDLKYYEDTDSWNSDPVGNTGNLVWNMYIILLFIFLSKELFYPLIQAYSKSSGRNKQMIFVLILCSVLAMLSNLLLPVLDAFGWPQVIRYLVANSGILGIFLVLYRRPFIGFYDQVEIHQIIIATMHGVPVYSTGDVVDASLASGAIYGISSILDEIGTKAGIESAAENVELKRKIELATNRFFIISQTKSIIIFHYSQHSGVCISKFTSLARLFREGIYEPEELVGEFQSSFVDYYPDLVELIYPNY